MEELDALRQRGGQLAPLGSFESGSGWASGAALGPALISQAAGRSSLDHGAWSARTMWMTPEGVPSGPSTDRDSATGGMGGGRPFTTTGSLASRVLAC